MITNKCTMWISVFIINIYLFSGMRFYSALTIVNHIVNKYI